ncbi:MAG: hypothetical protein ACUVRQ_04725 [Thermoanaerobaculaceae bacterium]
MPAFVLALAVTLPPIIPDPRLGPSSWAVVRSDLAFDGRPAGLLVELPQKVTQGWLQKVAELASLGVPLVSLGVPEARLVPYFDGVLVETREQAQHLASCCPGTWLVAAAFEPGQALERVAWGVKSLLVPGGESWPQELAEAFPEPLPARLGDKPLPTASRSQDLALLVGLPPGFPGGVVQLSTTWVTASGRLITAFATRDVKVKREGEAAWLEVPPLASWGLLVLPRPLPEGGLEKVEVSGQRSLSLEEVLARHHRQAAHQARFIRNFAAWQHLLVRVRVEELKRSFEVELAGPAFFTPDLGLDWELQKVWLDGVAWDVARLGELPLIQPKAPEVPPLALELEPSYRYELQGMEEAETGAVYVVSFAHQEEGGRRWGWAFIDAKTFGLVRLLTHLHAPQGEVRRAQTLTKNVLRWEDQMPLWVPWEVEADELVAAFGGVATVHKKLTLDGLHLNVPEVDQKRRQAWQGPLPMLRERSGVVRELVPDGSGGRRENGGKGKRQRFLLAGMRLDPSLDFPLPLAGYQLLDFGFRGREQLRLFLAGAVNDLAWSSPGKVTLSAGTFLQLVPFTSSFWLGDREDERQELRTFRQRLRGGVAKQQGPWYLALGLGVDQLHFGRTAKTAANFRLPKATQELTCQSTVHWQHKELLATFQGEMGRRASWHRWGFGEEAKPQFYRAGLALDYERSPLPLVTVGLGGEVWGSWKTDRFSRLALGGFGGLPFPGLPSDRVKPDGVALIRAKLAWPISLAGRLEVTAATGWFRETSQGAHARPLGGVAFGLSTRGPWNTLFQLRLEYPWVVPGPNQISAQLLLLRPW